MPKLPDNDRLTSRAARLKAEDAERRHQLEKLQGQRDARAAIIIIVLSVLICAGVAGVFYVAFSRP
jgi:cell division septal protein FtsQ